VPIVEILVVSTDCVPDGEERRIISYVLAVMESMVTISSAKGQEIERRTGEFVSRVAFGSLYISYCIVS
jgi:hypothetical protein